MDRRGFVKSAAMIPLVVGNGPLSWAGIGAAELGSAPWAAAGELAARYELTLRRVLKIGRAHV